MDTTCSAPRLLTAPKKSKIRSYSSSWLLHVDLPLSSNYRLSLCPLIRFGARRDHHVSSFNGNFIPTLLLFYLNILIRHFSDPLNFLIEGPDPAFGWSLSIVHFSLEPLRGYQGEDIEIQLPGNLTVYDIDWLAVWCVQYRHNFGHVNIPKDLDVPPALGQTKITVSHKPKPKPTRKPVKKKPQRPTSWFEYFFN